MADPSITLTVDTADLARLVAVELHRLEQARAQEIEEEYARQQAADGLDDQDGPVIRAELISVPNANGYANVWAHRGGDWWVVRWDGRWLPCPGTPVTTGAKPLGWVEIPVHTLPAAGEEQVHG
jgi:hypothetical protein